MFASFAISSAAIFVAELGDKSQLMAMTFATRFRAWQVLLGITIATTVVHAASVALGFGMGALLPTEWIGLVAGIAFLGFAAWTLRGDHLTEAEKSKAGRTARSAVIAVTLAFFLAELGDKTMLATVTLATDNNWVGVWIGSTIGMVAADALAIVLGAVLGKHLPERVIQIGAAVLFFVFGVSLFFEGLMPGTPAGLIAGGVVAALSILTVVALTAARRHRARNDRASFERSNALNDK